MTGQVKDYLSGQVNTVVLLNNVLNVYMHPWTQSGLLTLHKIVKHVAVVARKTVSTCLQLGQGQVECAVNQQQGVGKAKMLGNLG